MDIVDDLINFGLTRQEATMYLALVCEGSLSGYEVSKQTGVSRSNTYNGLAALVEKGAAYIIEGSVTRYSAVDVEEFCNNKIRYLSNIKDIIIENMPKPKENEDDGYITIKGQRHIFDKMQSMIENTKSHLYIAVTGTIMELVEPLLKALIDKGIKVVIITTNNYKLDGAITHYQQNMNSSQIRLIVDSHIVLTGEVDNKDASTCLYSTKKNLVDLFKESLKNEIKLIDIEAGGK